MYDKDKKNEKINDKKWIFNDKFLVVIEIKCFRLEYYYLFVEYYIEEFVVCFVFFGC